MRVFDEDASQGYALEPDPSSVGRPTLQVRGWAPFWGVVLVALCGMVLIGSFMVLERSERGGPLERARPQPTAAASPVGPRPEASAPTPPLAAARDPLPALDIGVQPNSPAARSVASAPAGQAEAPQIAPASPPPASPSAPASPASARAALSRGGAAQIGGRAVEEARAGKAHVRRKRGDPKSQSPSGVMPLPPPAAAVSELESKYGF